MKDFYGSAAIVAHNMIEQTRSTKKKVTTTVTIDEDLRDLAKRQGVVMSQAASAGIRDAVEVVLRSNSGIESSAAELVAAVFEREVSDREAEMAESLRDARVWAESFARSWRDIITLATLSLLEWESITPRKSLMRSLAAWVTTTTGLEPDETGFATIEYDPHGQPEARVLELDLSVSMLHPAFLDAVRELWIEILPDVLQRVGIEEAKAEISEVVKKAEPIPPSVEVERPHDLLESLGLSIE